MQVVGVDFGTTNIRISVWDPEQDASPETKRLDVGIQGGYPMPAVVALQQGADGEVSILVGEDAQLLQDVESDAILVIDNIKRYAMSPDGYVQGRLKEQSERDILEQWPPTWWDQETRCVRGFGREFPVWDLIKELLTEAFISADIQGDYEWRAGCPVHTNWEYRSALAETLSQVTGVRGSVNWIVEEPLLFLNSVLQLTGREIAGILGEELEGPYLVYDIGGGSFDCALVEVMPSLQVRIYGAEGHPALGGSIIDHQLRKNLGYRGPARLLRQAKESLTTESRAFRVQDDVILTDEDVGTVLKDVKFLEQSVSVLRDSYVGAKMLWKRGEGDDDPPVGEILHKNRDKGEVTFVWQMGWSDLAKDVKGIIVVGGTSKSHFVIPGAEPFEKYESFKDYLEKRFPETTIISFPKGGEDLAITGASKGACYVASSGANPTEIGYTPLYVNRLPVCVTLEDRQTGKAVGYKPFDHFTDSPWHPFDAFISKGVLTENPDDPYSEERYELTVTTPDGLLVKTVDPDGIERERQPVGKPYSNNKPTINTRLIGSSLRLVIDRFGQVAVSQQSANSAAKTFVIIENPPWQTPEQAEYLNAKMEQDKRYRDEEAARVQSLITRPPLLENE